ncbi:Levodione reductase [Jeotgalicoccus aerolatus]|uniref:NAD(P)-dependent dehydrogenase (Short-subunit alcohol dehydrogenase family) n=1 Tax=Jeotgalicoccus aerolatus TaxID=709510 RepID=A0ABS4HPY1_9STAP|nr:glucose 1-dehydrogenase [Jeotgalicoccus aerolatus]MBP1952985.1 NAD(P)-dependent dehydrogenase (short-subunit alcohol dehydrogenase family) [Jeotgalicoccus aerolatus]NMA81487.1 glucose 1-dehydrogenase [Jeotgalicoccus aerolatus]CAD2073141.1 Levodione reductase [Jeotgalicoccus aerolatus]GGE01612.1 short chain dehydrogenase [Jeotgalicoccus aerolatus]HJG33052.1 glucose 1-dehydrogenase [Jeotgalicoccus aerolatus]
MSKRFEDKVIIITGAASGLGQDAAVRVASEGAKLVLVDLNEEALKETELLIKKESSDAELLTVKADVSNEDEVKNYVDQAVKTFGKIDGFFNNAGIEGKQNLTEDYGSDEFQKVVNINLNGVFFGMKHVLKVMKEQGTGSIVNTASVGGIRGVGNQSGYSATKHGVVGLTRNSAVEYGQFGVNINAIAPGAIMTAMVEGSLKQMDPDNWEEAGKEFVSVNPMKRFGKPEEVSALVAFLLSEAGFINGAVINVDGGQSYKY